MSLETALDFQWRMFGWHLCVSLWSYCPPCTGSWFGCLHTEGEPDVENYEAVIPWTRERSIYLSAMKLAPAPKEPRP